MNFMNKVCIMNNERLYLNYINVLLFINKNNYKSEY